MWSRPDLSIMPVRPQSGYLAPLPFPVAMPSANPFAVSRVGLGEQEYLEPWPGYVGDVVGRLEQSGWRGQIVGPHGSGKTTLTLALARWLSPRFERFSWLVVQPLAWFGGRPRSRVQLAARSKGSAPEVSLELLAFPDEESGSLLLPRLRGLRPNELCFIDGLELLPTWRQRQALKAAGEHAVVVTTHRALGWGLAQVAELHPDLATFSQLVARLLGPAALELQPEIIEAAFSAAGGDFRRGLSLLYDEWESRRRADPSAGRG